MSFVSVPFILLFLGFCCVYYLLPKAWQWGGLLAGSIAFLLFYDLRYLVFWTICVLSTYFAICRMDRRLTAMTAELATGKDTLSREEKKTRRAEVKTKNRRTLILCLVLNYAMLFFCKAMLLPTTGAADNSYVGFLSTGLPLGISFYLFQSTGYCIDVYREKAKAQRDFRKFTLFVTYFPYLIQGPISSYGQLEKELYAPHAFQGKEWSFGVQRMLWGFFKKLVIANRIAPMVSALQDASLGGTGFFLLTVAYAVEIYGDFTGGIDLTIGMSQCLGIPLQENFLRPFFSKNIAEYWRRWHISLGKWMKDYIFYPISVSAPMLRLSKLARRRFGNFGKRLPVYVASVVTWLVTGIWHGLTPNFVLWGMLNCLVIILSEECQPLYAKFHAALHWKEKRWYGCFEILRMFILMNLIRVCDLFPQVSDYFAGFGRLFTNPNLSMLTDGTMLTLGLSRLDFGILVFGIGLMFAVSLFEQRRGSVRQWLWNQPAGFRYLALFFLLLSVLLLGEYGNGYDAGSFIYNKF